MYEAVEAINMLGETLMGTLFEILGWAGSLILALSAIPQCLKTYKTKSAKDLSWLFLQMWLIGVICLFSYTIYTNIQTDVYQYPLLANYTISSLCAAFLVVAKLCCQSTDPDN
ncbi:MAG: PQ-loop repeat-containing protein [Nanoarchaeota archaeon]